jgi:hypothetical protein
MVPTVRGGVLYAGTGLWIRVEREASCRLGLDCGSGLRERRPIG